MHGLLSPKVDFIFKKIFGNEKNPDILISFLNAVLQSDTPIVDVEIKNSDIEKDYLLDKFSRLDIKATTSNNEVVNIEIQRTDKKNMCERSLYYWSKIYSEKIISGENYSVLPKTICINILDYNLTEIKEENYHNIYRLSNISTGQTITDKLEMHFIELKKFKECDANNLLDLWVEFIQKPESSIVLKAEETNIAIKKAKFELTVISADDKSRENYLIREDILREEKFALNGARLEGIREGIKEGIKEGIREGIKEGIKEGELQKSLNIAKNSLDILDNETISKITGLDLDQIEDLRKNNN